MEHITPPSPPWFSTNGFMPHGHCYLWTPELLWTFVVSEALIALAYFSIPFALMYFVSQRQDLQFNWIFKLFSLFIFACGATHLIAIWIIWHPDYWLDALAKAATAIASLTAAILLWRTIPHALKFPGTAQLESAVARMQQEAAQRKAAEAELEQLKNASDERFRALFEQAAVGVAEVNSITGAFLRINQKYCDILGYSPAEMLHINCQSAIHPDDLPATREKLRAMRMKKLPELNWEQRHLRKDGSSIWVSVTLSPLWLPESSYSNYIAIVQDITARKRAEAAIEEQLDELRRWHAATLGHESRVQELKREVNELLAANGQPPRYASIDPPDPVRSQERP